MERLQGSHAVLELNDSRGIILSWDRTTPGELFTFKMERFQGSRSVLGWNDSRGVILSWDGTTPGESFCPGMEQLRGNHSVLVKRLQGSHSVLVQCMCCKFRRYLVIIVLKNQQTSAKVWSVRFRHSMYTYGTKVANLKM